MSGLNLFDVMSKLESLEDEALAANLLGELTQKNKHLGKLLLNTDKSLSHIEWKKQCDQAKKDVDEIITRIQKL
jgi:bifunctional N-acetylglucosamine-1-phosphate-uridyltransferase/glucosamine-1-phosphate-acetyltransferase GlmU-like protein